MVRLNLMLIQFNFYLFIKIVMIQGPKEEEEEEVMIQKLSQSTIMPL